MIPKCTTCHDTGEFYAATESVYLGWKTGYSHMYTLQPCPCTPRVVRVRTVCYVPQSGGRRAAVPFAVADAEIRKGNQNV